MKPIPLLTPLLALAAGALAVSAPALAQERIYRCANNEYTNQIKGRTDCTLVEGGNVTIVRSTSVPPRSSGGGAGTPASAPRNDSAGQRERDADAKAILEQELRRSESRQAELEKEYNNGEPEKVGSEAKNHQKYLDRVTELKASIERNQSDIEGIKRELARFNR
jgi:hypothetical protein